MTSRSNWRVSFGAFPIAVVGGGHVHTFIRISRPDGSVYAEYHGEPVDEDGHIRGDPASFVPGVHELRIVQYGGRRGLPALLPDNAVVQQYTLFEGSEEDVMALNDVMRGVGDAFQPVPYIAANPLVWDEGQNSNSVTRTLHEAMRRVGEARGTPVGDIPAQFLDDDVVFSESGRDSYAPGIHSFFGDAVDAAVSRTLGPSSSARPAGTQGNAAASGRRLDNARRSGGSSTSTGASVLAGIPTGTEARARSGSTERRVDELTRLMTTDPRRYRSGAVQGELRRLLASLHGDMPIVGTGGRTA